MLLEEQSVSYRRWAEELGPAVFGENARRRSLLVVLRELSRSLKHHRPGRNPRIQHGILKTLKGQLANGAGYPLDEGALSYPDNSNFFPIKPSSFRGD